MKWNELSNTLTIKERKINDINTIKSKIESQLNEMKARTYVTDNAITFSTLKLYVPSGSLMDRSDSLRIIKEGKIDINKESHSLEIQWSVKLDSLYFLSLCSSFVAGTAISLYANTELIISVIFGIALFFTLVFFGMLFILSSMNELVLASVYNK